MALTTDGIAAHILGALDTHKRRFGTANDCKVVVNHLIRKFSEPLAKAQRLQQGRSVAVARGETDNTVVDHAVPVIVILDQLLQLKEEQLALTPPNIQFVTEFLAKSLILVEITSLEDKRLSEKGLQRRMPELWDLNSGDPLARYEAANIEITLRCLYDVFPCTNPPRSCLALP